MNELTQNTILNRGQYRIVKVIGRGGFGITYLAEQIGYYRSTGFGEEFVSLREPEEVVIKELFYSDYCSRDSKTGLISISNMDKKKEFQKLVKNQLDEGWIIRELNHPHIIKTRDIFEENDTAYMVMDYIESTDLEDLVKDGKRLPIDKALKYIYETLDAVDYFHTRVKKRILHLDISPSNILVNKKDQAILIDFGAALTYDGTSNSVASSTSQIVTGRKKHYSPNEQSDIDLLKSFDATFDTYAVGATLYHLLSGALPQLSNMVSSGREKFIPPSHQAKDAGISQYLDAVVAKAMAPMYKDRYFSAKELWEDLKKDEAYRESIKEIQKTLSNRDLVFLEKLLKKHKSNFLPTDEFSILESDADLIIQNNEKPEKQQDEEELKLIKEKIEIRDLESAKIRIARYKNRFGPTEQLKAFEDEIRAVEEAQETMLLKPGGPKESKDTTPDEGATVLMDSKSESIPEPEPQPKSSPKNKPEQKPDALKSKKNNKKILIVASIVVLLPLLGYFIFQTGNGGPNNIDGSVSNQPEVFEENGLFGYKIGEEILLPAEFTSAGVFVDDTAEAVRNDSVFTIDSTGELIFIEIRNRAENSALPMSEPKPEIAKKEEEKPKIDPAQKEKETQQKAEEERKRKDELEQGDWNVAKTANTIQSYRNYINNYPNGKFISDANSRIVQLEKEEKDKQQKEAAQKMKNKESDDLYNIAKQMVDRGGLEKCKSTAACKNGVIDYLNQSLKENPSNTKAKSLLEQIKN